MDSTNFANCTCEQDKHKLMQLELGRDNRKTNTKGNIITRYKNYMEWNNTQLSRDIEKAVNLIPEDGVEVSVRDLRLGLKSYGFTDEYSNKIVREAGSNDRRVSARKSAFDPSVDEIKLSRV